MASPGSTNALRHLNCTRLWNFLGVSFNDLGMEGGIVGGINYISPSWYLHSHLQQCSVHKSSSIHRIHSSSIYSSNGSTLNIRISICMHIHSCCCFHEIAHLTLHVHHSEYLPSYYYRCNIILTWFPNHINIAWEWGHCSPEWYTVIIQKIWPFHNYCGHYSNICTLCTPSFLLSLPTAKDLPGVLSHKGGDLLGQFLWYRAKVAVRSEVSVQWIRTSGKLLLQAAWMWKSKP